MCSVFFGFIPHGRGKEHTHTHTHTQTESPQNPGTIPRKLYLCVFSSELFSRKAPKVFLPVKLEKAGPVDFNFKKNTPHGRRGQGPGSVDPRFPAGLPFPVPEILEFIAFSKARKP